MGAWGTGAFENDTALDWVGELEDANDLAPVTAAIERVLQAGDEYLDSDVASEGLAACEVIARLKGAAGQGEGTEAIDRWVRAYEGTIPPDLATLAATAIDRILTPDSELLDLWQDVDDFEAWKNAVLDLRQRVTQQ